MRRIPRSYGINIVSSVEIPQIAAQARVLSAKQVAELCGLSLPHFRRLYRTGRVPPPIKIGQRKMGWQYGTVATFLASKTAAAA